MRKASAGLEFRRPSPLFTEPAPAPPAKLRRLPLDVSEETLGAIHQAAAGRGERQLKRYLLDLVEQDRAAQGLPALKLR